MKVTVFSLIAAAGVASATYPVQSYPSYPAETSSSAHVEYPTSTAVEYPSSSSVEYPSSSKVEYPSTTEVVHPTTTPAPEYPYGSTVYETDIETITSCPPEVTDCPASSTKVYVTKPLTVSYITETQDYTTNGSKTKTVVVKTTICPVEETHVPKPYPSKDSHKPYPYPSSVTVVYPHGTGVPQPPKDTYAPQPPKDTYAPQPPKDTYVPKPVLSTVTVSTCVPTVVTSVVTVSASKPAEVTYPAGGPATTYPGGESSLTTVAYPSGAPSATGTGAYYPTTVPYTGSASTQKVGAIMMAVVGAAALLL